MEKQINHYIASFRRLYVEITSIDEKQTDLSKRFYVNATIFWGCIFGGFALLISNNFDIERLVDLFSEATLAGIEIVKELIHIIRNDSLNLF